MGGWQGVRRLAGGVLLVALLVFSALVGLLFTFQRDLMYPVPAIDHSVPHGFERITYKTADGLTLKAGYRPALRGMPTVLFFHGNGADWQSTAYTTKVLAAAGYGVLAAEYRGYSGNPGTPDEQGLYADGAAAVNWLGRRGIGAQDIVLVGNSLGSGVAVELAGKINPRALILVSPFKSMAATAANSYPWAPVDWLLLDRFDNIAKIGAVAAPVLVIHGDSDGLIPVAHARELATANADAKFLVLKGRGHNLSGEEAAQIPQLRFLEGLGFQ